MPVVPIRPGAEPAAPTVPPPDETYLMMAAAQMHKEGRLVKPNTSGIPETTRRSMQPEKQGSEEWETQDGLRNTGEGPGKDETGNIMRNLQINKLMARRGYDI
jgi:hypothetical protein